MLEHTLVSESAAHMTELEKAFGAFNRLSNELQSSYQTLQQRVARLTGELEEARRASQEAASAAQRTAERLRTLLATLPGGVVVVDDGGQIQEHNRIAAEILGHSLVGESWQRVVKDVLQSPTSADGDWSTRDGRRIALAASSLPQESVKIILLTDVTETRALQELAARNQRLSAIGKMAASLAHQIRTPLAGALLYLSQCRSRRDDRERGTLLEKGIERLRHLDLLVQDMLVFARGKGPGERVRVADLFRAVHDAAMAVKPPNAHLVIHGSDVLVELDGNSTALTAALTNLVNNAFEASPDVIVTLKAKLRGDRVEFTVRDNGPGIAPSIQSRVFEPFFSTRPAGTGLGLAVVKTVAEAHGGDLALHSEGGRGTRIDMNLPRTAAVAEPLPAKSAAREVA
jgi:two-component system, sensor histidine kinase FlrB